MSVKIEILLLLLAQIAVHGRTHFGRCTKPEKQKNFDISKYTGVWHEIVRLKDSFETGDCVKANYTSAADEFITVVNSQNLNGTYDSAQGTAFCDTQNSGQCYVKFHKFQPWGDYEVIETDYDNYSIVYSCTSIAFLYKDMVWILARSKDFDPKEKIGVLRSLGFVEEELLYTNQKNCPE
jgi:apolipoprotein D and lipocalin family protein